MKSRCADCAFARQHNTVLVCRRYPPTAVWVERYGDVMSLWPKVEPDDWCAEFQIPRGRNRPYLKPGE